MLANLWGDLGHWFMQQLQALMPVWNHEAFTTTKWADVALWCARAGYWIDLNAAILDLGLIAGLLTAMIILQCYRFVEMTTNITNVVKP